MWLGRDGDEQNTLGIASLRNPKNRAAGTIGSLSDLPAAWWQSVDSDVGGYQWISTVSVLGKDVRVLLDTGAAVNAVTEEFVVGLLNFAAQQGIKSRDERYPVLQLEKWAKKEQVAGVAKAKPVQLVGAVVLRVSLGGSG